MTPDVKLRAFDPFFTTKTRRLSTGLGLSLVHGVVTASRGTIDVRSARGEGTTVILSFPAEPASPGAAPEVGGAARGMATVSLADQRTAAWVSGLLASAGYEVERAAGRSPDNGILWVTEPRPENLPGARAFLGGDPARRVIVLGEADGGWSGIGAVVVEDTEELEAIRNAIRAAMPGTGAEE